MRQNLHRFYASLLALSLCAGAATAQNVAVNSVSFPKAQASTSQPVRFLVHNFDFRNPISATATVGIKEGDKVLCEKEVQLDIPKMGNQEVSLPIRLHTDYGKAYAYTIYINVDGNTNKNHDMDVSFTMPTTIGWPLNWSSSLAGTDVAGFGNYQYFADPDMFVAQGRVSVVNNGGVQTLPVTFDKGKAMTGHFCHYSDLASTVYAIVDYGERVDTVLTQACAASTKLVDHYFSFTPDSTAIVRLAAKVQGAYNTYGQMQLGQLSLYEAKPDLALTDISAPAAAAVCTAAGGYEVKVRVTNSSPFDIANPVLAFSFGQQQVSETYDGTIKAFETVDYTFKTRLAAATAAAGQLTATVTAADDGNDANNALSTPLNVYDPLPFPYTTAFDSGNDLWTTYDGNADGVTWGFESDASFGNIVYFPSAALASNDWLFSPAVSMPEGRSRISFYYTGGRMLTQHLRLLMGTEPSPDKMTEVLFDEDVKNNGWLNGYHLIDMPEAGVRYFAFQTTGRSDQIIIDNVKIDRADDLCIGGVGFAQTSGFGRTASDVTLTYINHGVTAQKDVTLRYWLSTPDDPYTDGKAPYAEETAPGEIQPGEALTYTFKKKADVSTPGQTYSLVGKIATVVGDDQQNDIIAGTVALENWKMPELPYTQGFEDATTAQKQWVFAANGTSKWQVGNNTAGAYQGSKSLCHTGKVAAGNEDWAFSEPLRLTKGSYDLSFFYRTSKNQKQATYSQTFRAMLATAPQADKATVELMKADNLLLPGQWARKFTSTIDIAEDGTYYLAFGNTTPNTLGMTFIDNISLAPHADGHALPYKLALDADNAEDGMEKYYPSSALPQWKLTAQDDGTMAEVVERTKTFSDMSYGSEGYLVLPKLQVGPGRDICLTFDYSLVCGLTPGMTLDVYDGTVSNPDGFKLRASLPVVADGSFKEARVVLPAQEASTNYFVALRTSAPEEGADMKGGYVYTAKVRNIAVDYDTTTGISDASAGGAVLTVDGGKVVADAPDVSVYDVAGRLVARAVAAGGKATLTLPAGSGMYVVKAGGRVLKVRR